MAMKMFLRADGAGGESAHADHKEGYPDLQSSNWGASQAAKVEHHHCVQGKDGSKGTESQMGWDVKQNISTA